MAKSEEETAKYFKNQNYSKLKNKWTGKKKQFEDPEFAPKAALRDKKFGKVAWKRPTEICGSPKLVESRLNGSSVTQGQLGNCWFVAACCSLAQEPDLWKKVVPDATTQDYTQDGHTGLFQFKFWRFGRWISVVIDDRLPTINGRLILAHSKNSNEFWCSLLEKAYAKLFGSYDALDGGNLIDALIDFTGGFGERFDLEEEQVKNNEEKRHKLFEHLKNEKKHHTLMCCALGTPPGARMESETPLGLVRGHAYCITDVRYVDIKRTGLFAMFKGREKLSMIRLRNPWGEVEWRGPFSDSSAEWKKITKQDKEKCGLTFDEDGEFWMTFEDFCVNFSTASACHLMNTSWFSFSQTWNEAMFYGSWTTGAAGSGTDRAGGCSNHKNFLQNPQYCLDVKTDEDKLMVMLQQPDHRAKENKMNSIGFQIYQVELNRKYRVHKLWEKCVGSSAFMDTRNVFKSMELRRGRYAILPTTFEPSETGHFLLRMFTKHNVNFRELSKEAPKQPILSLFSKYRSVTYVKVTQGVNMRHEGDALYFVVSCEGQKAKGWALDTGSSPKWNQGAIFYQKSNDRKMKIQIYQHKTIRDTLVAEGIFEAPKANQPKILIVNLNSKDKGTSSYGQLQVETCNSNNLKQF